MIKKIYIAALCLVTAHAFGKHQKITERPYSEENLVKLASNLPYGMEFANSFETKLLIFPNNKGQYVRTLPLERKKQYYKLLQKYYSNLKAKNWYNNISEIEKDIINFAQENKFGKLYTFPIVTGVQVVTDIPTREFQKLKILVELTGTEFEKKFAKLSPQEKAEYRKLSRAVKTAHENYKKDGSIENFNKLLSAKIYFQKFQIRVGLASVHETSSLSQYLKHPYLVE